MLSDRETIAMAAELAGLPYETMYGWVKQERPGGIAR